jgi:hypothetical protein
MPEVSYRAMLKPLDVEELIDLAVHRPLAYALTRAAYPTAITPDQITWVSMFVGILAGAAAWSSFLFGAPRLVLAGGLFVLSAVFDCSDGQLARLRGTSSPFGRMLDGAVDMVVQLAVVPGFVAHVWWKTGGPGPAAHGGGQWMPAALWLVLGIGATASGALHTTLYDRYKNIYLHHTQPAKGEGEDPEDLASSRGDAGDWLRRHVAVPYLARQMRVLAWLDPYIPGRFRDMPRYSPETAERFRREQRGLMRGWTFYGIGTHIFGLAAAAAFDKVEWYILARLVLFNLALAALVAAQRRASRAFFQGSAPA